MIGLQILPCGSPSSLTVNLLVVKWRFGYYESCHLDVTPVIISKGLYLPILPGVQPGGESVMHIQERQS